MTPQSVAEQALGFAERPAGESGAIRPASDLLVVELVRAATLAPSPDNNQPWRFEFREGRLLVFADASRGLPSDTDGMFCLLALGAAVENICLAARAMGYAPTVKCLVEKPPLGAAAACPPVAEVTFQPSDAERDPLVDQLTLRCTCRRPFDVRAIGPEKLARLSAAAAEAGDVRVDWLLRREELDSVAQLVAAGDRIRFEYQPFHAELYRQLRFRRAEAEQTRDGLDLRTLELPPGGGLMLHLLRSWTFLSALNRLGFSRLLTLSAAKLVRCSGAIGALSVPECEGAAAMAHYLAAGRAFQRLWLTTHSEGLALHPLGSLPIFMRPSAQRAALPRHRRLAEKITREFAALVPETSQRVTTILFRIGHAKPPDVRSLRRSPEDVLEQF
ncbi:MAG TPA: hypothetical protein VMV10_20445 [Pirellulales bacterium]|nr:hypothetical protein [Pirellulales bacterium]